MISADLVFTVEGVILISANVHSSIIYKNQKVKITQRSTNWWTDKTKYGIFIQ